MTLASPIQMYRAGLDEDDGLVCIAHQDNDRGFCEREDDFDRLRRLRPEHIAWLRERNVKIKHYFVTEGKFRHIKGRLLQFPDKETAMLWKLTWV